MASSQERLDFFRRVTRNGSPTVEDLSLLIDLSLSLASFLIGLLALDYLSSPHRHLHFHDSDGLPILNFIAKP